MISSTSFSATLKGGLVDNTDEKQASGMIAAINSADDTVAYYVIE